MMKMAAKFNKEVLLSASYSSLTGVALSVEAAKLRHGVETMLDLAAQRQRAMGAATAQRASEALDAFLADLLGAAANEASQGFICRPMEAGRFTKANGCKASYRHFITYVQTMEAKGLIEVLIGFRRRTEFDGFSFESKGQLTRIRATPSLLSLVSNLGVKPSEISRHYRIEASVHDLVRVKADKKGPKEGARIFLPPSARMLSVYSEMQELNERFGQHTYSLGAAPQLHRVFNQGDAKGFDFDRGGRLSTSDGARGYQQISAADRLGILIDQEPIAEIDIKSCHPTILYALSQQPLPAQDLYYVTGIPRDVVKAFVVVMIGEGSTKLTRWPDGAKSMFMESLRNEGPVSTYRFDKLYSLKEVTEWILQAIPPLRMLKKGKLDWAKLQYLESRVIVAAMLRCSRELGVPALPVHDSLIVPARVAADVDTILKAEFEKVTGYLPITVINQRQH